MTASGRENGADAEHPRSRNLPLGNGGPQCENNIGITGAHVAHGSETGGQRDCRVVSRIESDLGIGIFDRTQSVSLVELRRQVHVAIDEPRKDEFLAKIDKLTARRRIDEAARHRLDPLAFDKNALLRFGLYVWIGEQNASVNNLRLPGPDRIVCHGLFRPSERAAMGLCLENVPASFQTRYVVPVSRQTSMTPWFAWLSHLPNNYADNPHTVLGKVRMDELFAGAQHL